MPIAHRGKQLAQNIMIVLENELIANGIYISRLETGFKSKDAIGLYLKLGYIERSRFGSYKADPLNTFMEKKLDIKKLTNCCTWKNYSLRSQFSGEQGVNQPKL